MYTVCHSYRDDFLSDAALMRSMRLLAVQMQPDGRARLEKYTFARRAADRLHALLSQIPAHRRAPALQKAADAAGFFEAAAFAPAARGRKDLPAYKGEARILRIAREILLHSGMKPDVQRVYTALRAFSQERELRMEELVRFPDALREECLHLFACACEGALGIQKERLAAEKWLQGSARMQEGCVFLEHALRLKRENEPSPELEKTLSSQEGGAQGVLARAHEYQARICTQLSDLPAAMHTADLLDPQKLLSLCQAGRMLCAAPCYTACDEESRAFIRRCVGEISACALVSEEEVVRCALELAASAPAGSLQSEGTWYWTEDEGRALLLRRLSRADSACKKRTPDPNGYFYMTAVFLSAAALFAVLLSLELPAWALPFGLIVSWTIAGIAANAVCVRLFPAKPLLRLELKSVPDNMRTLVVIPALLPDGKRAKALISQLEILAAGEKDANVEFCLAGDFPDASDESMSGDGDILHAAREAADEANRRSGGRRIYFLHRKRQWNAHSAKWMGRERKRGALKALNSLLLTGENAFDADGADASFLSGRFRFVITLDADTVPYPGSLRMLIGAAAHPVNRLSGKNVLQPHMALSLSGKPSAFAQFMGGVAGVNGYSGAVTEVYQDLCGQGGFAGKGIYDLASFDRLAGNCLPDNAILSHDLLEGFLAGSAFAGDIVFLDRFPSTLSSYFKRMHRWTRGDWQLLPFLRGRTPLQKYRLLDNLRSSLASLSALGLIFAALFAGNTAALLLALLIPMAGWLLSPTAENFLRCLSQLSLLPNEAFCRGDAIVRALYRTFVSHRNMLEWVSAADAENQTDRTSVFPRIFAAVACVFLSAAGDSLLSGLALGCIFLAGAPLLENMASPVGPQGLCETQREFLRTLAADTWRFFAEYTGENGLPPDNVQFEPHKGAADRTSPTNIGLYMASCVAAKELGLISADEMRSRLHATAATLSRIEKWRGMPYNWVDPVTGKPLSPRYVSSVDSGNLAACLLLCAQAVRQTDPALSDLLESLAREMDLASLYDPLRHLFCIGFDVQNGTLSQSHYDLLASEARILSYTAMLLGKVPLAHWKHLSRACVSAADTAVPLSWSGTMFEYLMPGLFLDEPSLSLLGEGCRGCVALQMLHRPGGFWGVSESGCYSFDAARNYQYRAFGLRRLMSKDESDAQVVSPYSAALALRIAPAEAAENLLAMHAAGFTTPCGLAEAIDFAPSRTGDEPFAIVKSAMAHHQGMLLLACANALCGEKIRDFYAKRPDALALSPILEETPGTPRSASRRQPARKDAFARIPRSAGLSRKAQAGCTPPDGHLICAGGSSLYINADDAACLHSHGLLVNRWRFDNALSGDGFFTHVREKGSAPVSLTRKAARFSPGSARFLAKTPSLDIRLDLSVSPEDGALVRIIELSNRTEKDVCAELRDISFLALCSDAQSQDHQSFQDLFWEASFPAKNCLRLKRRKRTAADAALSLDYCLSGLGEKDEAALFFDRSAFLRRGADPSCAQHVFSSELKSRAPGAGISPVQGAKIVLNIPAHSTKTLGLSTLLSRDILPEPDRYAQTGALHRAKALCEEQALALARFLDIDADLFSLFGRAASLCMYARPMQKKPDMPLQSVSKNELWPLGISGDLPLLSARADLSSSRAAVDILRLQAYLAAMDVRTEALILCDEPAGYHQPLRDDLAQRIAQTRTHGENIVLVSQNTADEAALRAAVRFSVLFLEADQRLSDAVFAKAPIFPAEKALPALPAAVSPYGGFSENGKQYTLRLRPGETTPRAWCNILAGQSMGALVTENGGGFLWHENSRSGRLTAFGSDVQESPCPLRVWLEENGEAFSLIPRPLSCAAEVSIRPGESEFLLSQNGLRVRIVRCTHPAQSIHALNISIEADSPRDLRLRAACLWLMGTHATDMRFLRTEISGECTLAAGSGPSVGCMRLVGSHGENGCLVRDIHLESGAPFETVLCLSAAETAQQALSLAQKADFESIFRDTRTYWEKLLNSVQIDTGDSAIDSFIGTWAPYQAISARLFARTGPNQPGGAYGFRDQLQDVLCLIPVCPQWAREHLLLCAAHQFPEGDVQHWWHPPRTGVRTRISDDLLFLPYVAAQYVLETGDSGVLFEPVPYLSGETIPENAHDIYAETGISELTGPLYEHCMRAVRRVAGMLGAHSLPLMGCGDWNDGMDRMGAQGKGESVWLGQFLCVVARDFAGICPQYADELRSLSQRMLENIERYAWDGDRYLRAFRDDGTPVGSSKTHGGCKIDVLSQSWAVFAGCDPNRTEVAMDTLWHRLYDENLGILRLLDPPFDGNTENTGYIAAYPPGIRENGGQYTHAACWALAALAKCGQRQRTWTLLRALLPENHCATRAQADLYQAEPYALAADIYACSAAYAGRAGWTWYTGSAGWLFRAFLVGIAGFERRGNKVRLCALLDDGMDELRVRLRFGSTFHTLISGKKYQSDDFVELTDDGNDRIFYFSAK